MKVILSNDRCSLTDQLINSIIGIDSPYEKPGNPDIHIKSDELLPDAAAELILNKLIQKEII